MGKKIAALVIEELPEHVHGQKGIVVFRSVVIDKPLKALDFIASIVFDEIEHAALVGVESGRNVLEKECSIRVNGDNIF